MFHATLGASATWWVKNWTPSLTAIVTAIGVLASIIFTVREYSLKSKAQANEARARTVETEVRLTEAFAQLVPIANGRQGVFLSEAAVTAAMGNLSGVPDAKQIQAVVRSALASGLVGQSTQLTAIAALGDLASRHSDVLGVAGATAIAALEDDYGDDPAFDGALKGARQQLSGAPLVGQLGQTLDRSRDVRHG